MTDLAGKTALVTGAGSGIGKAIALSLAREHANLILAGRDLKRLREAASLCEKEGIAVECYPVDLFDAEQIGDLARQAARRPGDIDILIHCAGIIRLGSLAEAQLRDFDHQFQCNVRAPFFLTQLLLPGLIRRQGQIVFINSTLGLAARAGASQYAATKHALKALADSFREELNPAGVRVISVYLGRTATPMQAQVHEAERKPYHPENLIQPEQVSGAVIQALRIGREAEITDVRIRPFKTPQ